MVDPTSLWQFFWGLVPQKDDDAVQLYNWRWKSVLLGVVTLGLAIYSANWFPFLTSPYALADVVKHDKEELQNKVDSTNRKVDATNNKLDDLSGKVTVVLAQQHESQIHQVSNDLLDARRYQCRAVLSQDQSARPFWNGRIAYLKLQYQQLTGDSWSDQDCNSF